LRPPEVTAGVEFAGLSDIGRLRTNNQDRWGAQVDEEAEQSLFMVADGVACSTDGALAAGLVVELLPTYVARHLATVDGDDAAAADAVGQAVAEFCDDFRAYADSDARVAGTNSTVVAVVVSGSRALVVHMGDSRAYLRREQQLQQLTRDHSVIQELIDANEVDPADAGEHPSRNVITRHVAMYPQALPETSVVELRPGDRILLSSDGLHGVVDEAALAQILDAHPDPDKACAALIDAANQAGGPDNITAVVIAIAGTGQ
jgi:PPM family protein phosphatase